MRELMISVLGWLFFCSNAASAVLNNDPSDSNPIIDDMPRVFLLGEYETAFEKLTADHSTMLLEACGDDIDVAFEKWFGMIKEMEAHSEAVNYDLKGVKVWLNIFWDEDGSVKHLAYYLKPNSKNVDLEKLNLFFQDFLNNYTFPFQHDKKFSHYGSATFPTVPRRIQQTAKKKQLPDEVATDTRKY